MCGPTCGAEGITAFRYAARSIAHLGADCALPSLDALPKAIINQPQVLDIFRDPFFRRVWTCLSFARRRLLNEPLAVPDAATDVKFIV